VDEWEAGAEGKLMALWMDRLGLFMNLVGSILIAISFGRPPSEFYQILGGHKISMAAFLRPWALYLGIALLIGGFALSLVATFSN
jgi:hypothetical protein